MLSLLLEGRFPESEELRTVCLCDPYNCASQTVCSKEPVFKNLTYDP